MTEVAAGSSPTAVQEGDRSTPLHWRLAPVGVALGSLAVGLIASGNRSLTTDEAVAYTQAREPLGTVLSTIVHHEPGQAGELLLLKLATTFGLDEGSLRAPSAVAVAIAAGLLVALGTMLVGRVGGLIAGVALAANAGVVEVSREARPYALGILGIVVATALFAFALERGGGWRWVPYAIAAAALPLTHPVAASVLAAHGVALLAMRDRTDLRRAVAALGAGGVAAGLLLAAAVVDRLEAPDGARSVDLAQVGRGLAQMAGWSPVLVVAATAGLFAFFSGRAGVDGRRRGALVALLIAAPIAATLLTNLAFPVFTGPLVLGAPGIALAAGAAAPLLPQTRERLWTGVGILLLASGSRGRSPAELVAQRGLAGTRGGRQERSCLPGGRRRDPGAIATRLHVLRPLRADPAECARLGYMVGRRCEHTRRSCRTRAAIGQYAALRAPAASPLRQRAPAAALGASVEQVVGRDAIGSPGRTRSGGSLPAPRISLATQRGGAPLSGAPPHAGGWFPY